MIWNWNWDCMLWMSHLENTWLFAPFFIRKGKIYDPLLIFTTMIFPREASSWCFKWLNVLTTNTSKYYQQQFKYTWIYAWMLDIFNCQYDFHRVTKIIHKFGGWWTWNTNILWLSCCCFCRLMSLPSQVHISLKN